MSPEEFSRNAGFGSRILDPQDMDTLRSGMSPEQYQRMKKGEKSLPECLSQGTDANKDEPKE